MSSSDKYTLATYWDNLSAEYRYTLILYVDGVEKFKWSGDEKWAIRQSKHYNIKVNESEGE